jgi:energy-coupling factor transporter ATP-binding protein EcfA2
MYETVVVQGLVKHYGDGGRVGPISLTVRRQEVYGLVGPNGSGKTTTIRAILGLLKPSSGTVTVMGYNPFKETKKVNLLVGYSPEIPVYPSFLLCPPATNNHMQAQRAQPPRHQEGGRPTSRPNRARKPRRPQDRQLQQRHGSKAFDRSGDGGRPRNTCA